MKGGREKRYQAEEVNEEPSILPQNLMRRLHQEKKGDEVGIMGRWRKRRRGI